jgi:diadenosine tetraphosphate (Ap4A) HIT family hydrolase
MNSMTPPTSDAAAPETCPLCGRILDGEATHSNLRAAAIRDAFPISPGHTLVVSRRHVAGFFDLDRDEQAAVIDLVNVVRNALDDELHPDGYNVGVNVGAAAGQTVPHVHVHVIPRYTGDVPDPRGGVRWVFPDRAPYWHDQT